ncbi:MAG TPA: EXLDI protein [Candidatus Saccharimonadales bacterium]|nr:EXLDI protein [Candidatus Saccharimonadales bacterium]
MSNKTIYVSQKDETLFEEAQQLAGEALSSVIARALREFVSRSKQRDDGMKEISIKVGIKGSEREQRFIGSQIGKWQGLSDDRTLFQNAKIYITNKKNLAILLTTVSKASLLTNPDKWKKSGDYLENSNHSELFVAENAEQFKDKLPADLMQVVINASEKEEKAVEYLDI